MSEYTAWDILYAAGLKGDENAQFMIARSASHLHPDFSMDRLIAAGNSVALDYQRQQAALYAPQPGQSGGVIEDSGNIITNFVRLQDFCRASPPHEKCVGYCRANVRNCY